MMELKSWFECHIIGAFIERLECGGNQRESRANLAKGAT